MSEGEEPSGCGEAAAREGIASAESLLEVEENYCQTLKAGICQADVPTLQTLRQSHFLNEGMKMTLNE